MKTRVTKAYERPYENPIAVSAGAQVDPDFDRRTDIAGWVWCTAEDGRSGWAPRGWLAKHGDEWHLVRDFDAIELAISPGEFLEVEFEESGFYWASRESGEHGWVPCDHVSLFQGSEHDDSSDHDYTA